MGYKDKKKQKEYQRTWRNKRRIQEREKSFALLGGKCVECGIDDFRILQIDHIKPIKRRSSDDRERNSGSGLRQRISNGSLSIKGLQLLCANCHQIKSSNDIKTQ